MIKLLTMGLALSLSLSLYAQKICNAKQVDNQIIEKNSYILDERNENKKQIKSYVDSKDRFKYKLNSGYKSEGYTITAVVHILYSNSSENFTDEQVKEAIDSLNLDFNGLNSDVYLTPDYFFDFAGVADIKTQLATVDPDGNSTSGIVRKEVSNPNFTSENAYMFDPAKQGVELWDPYRYVNIIICPYTDPSSAGSIPLGFATLPPSGNFFPTLDGEIGSPIFDGIVINYSYFAIQPSLNLWGRTLTHELGHYLGLNHIWGDDECGDDEVDDTPTHEYIEGNSGCPIYPHNANSICGTDEEGEMFMNFMDYTSDQCMFMFSIGQTLRMNYFLENSVRKGLWDPNYNSSIATDSKIKIDIMPNPAQNRLSINADYKGEVEVSIYDAIGKEMLKSSFNGLQNQTLDVSTLDAGLYIIAFNINQEVVHKKFIKE